MWVLKLVSCFRVTRAEACKLCVRLHIVVADAAVVAVAVAWHECLMRDGSDRQLLPAIGTNAGHTGQTKKQKAKQSKPKKKKEKYNLRRVDVDFICTFFFTSLLLLFSAQCLGFASSCKDSTPMFPRYTAIASLPRPLSILSVRIACLCHFVYAALPARRKLRHF